MRFYFPICWTKCPIHDTNYKSISFQENINYLRPGQYASSIFTLHLLRKNDLGFARAKRSIFFSSLRFLDKEGCFRCIIKISPQIGRKKMSRQYIFVEIPWRFHALHLCFTESWSLLDFNFLTFLSLFVKFPEDWSYYKRLQQIQSAKQSFFIRSKK